MGGGSPKSTTTTTIQQIDPDLKAEAVSQLAEANRIAAVPYQAYGGERVAGFSQDQLSAFDAIRNSQGQASAGIGAAMGWTADAANYTPQMLAGNYAPQQVQAGQIASTDLSQYMSPYSAAVKATALAENERARQGAQVSNADAQINAGAWGGSRAAVQNATTDAEFGRNAATISAQIDDQAYKQAVSSAQADIAARYNAATANQQAGYNAAALNQQAASANQSAWQNAAQMRLAAGNQFGNLALAGQQAVSNDVALLSGAGAQQQALTQSGLQLAYENWLDQQNQDLAGLQIRQSVLGTSPGNSSGSTTAPVAGKNRAMGAAGGAMSGAALGATVGGPYGAAIGGVVGGLYGALS